LNINARVQDRGLHGERSTVQILGTLKDLVSFPLLKKLNIPLQLLTASYFPGAATPLKHVVSRGIKFLHVNTKLMAHTLDTDLIEWQETDLYDLFVQCVREWGHLRPKLHTLTASRGPCVGYLF
jgi:hypothetical protein